MRVDRRQQRCWNNLYLVRHGESTANEINRFAGSVDAPLTSLGTAQARRAGKSWKDGTFDRVFISPMTRARQTADIILESLSDNIAASARKELDDRIAERHFGDFTLKNKTRLQRDFGLRNYEASLYQSDAGLHGGESFEAFRERVLQFLKHTLYPAISQGQRVLVVAHKYVIELLSRLIIRLPETHGYDLRLPNARILSGARLREFVKAESQHRNLIKDWILVHHSPVLALSALAGLITNAFGVLPVFPAWLMLVMLMIATGISLARVSLKAPGQTSKSSLLSPRRLFVRFILLPWMIVGLCSLFIAPQQAVATQLLIAVTLLVAAPAATTAIVLSRGAGGMILPAVVAILVSTAMSSANTIGLLAWFGRSDLMLQGFLFVGLSLLSLALPMVVVQWLRQTHPISTAKFAEDNASLSVLALAAFVVVAFQNIQLASFFPNGLLAIVLGIGLRLLAVQLARQGSLYGTDDYFAMSYPNIFLVILLASLTGNPVALELATWFLVPMFVLAPLDDRLITSLQNAQSQSSLTDYLQIGDYQSRAEIAATPLTDLVQGTVPAHQVEK